MTVTVSTFKSRRASRRSSKKYYNNNRDAILQRQREIRTGRDKDKLRQKRIMLYEERRLKLEAIKLASGCKDCGYKVHSAALDFDHLDNTEKSFQLAACFGRPWQDVLEEIAKCEIVCANCHRIRTFNRRRRLCV